MPTRPLITWQGLAVEVAEDGCLAHVRLEGHDEDLLTDVRVAMGEGWEPLSVELLLDEVEQRHELRRDGALVATAVVRVTFDDTWGVRVQLRNESDVEVSVPPARLDFTSGWPARVWLAGAEGSISLDAGRADGQLLTFTQLRGRSRLSDGCCWLTDLPVLLGPAGTPAGMYQVSWRVDWLRDERMQAAALPRWWPASTVLRSDETLELELPDAAIEAAGISILDDERTSILSARPGHHLAQVHAGRGTTDVDLFWADDLVTAHLQPVVRDVMAKDPRLLAAHEVFLLGRALPHGVGEDLHEVLPQAVESLAARPGPVAPLALAAVADEVMRTSDPALVDQLGELAGRVRAAPGAVTAWLHASVSLRMQGVDTRLPTPGGQPDGAVARAVVALETELLRRPGHPSAAAVRTMALLGAGLPGVTVGPHDRAVLVAVLGQVPEGWDDQPRWPVPLGIVRDRARDQLLAERCDQPALAWLLW